MLYKVFWISVFCYIKYFGSSVARHGCHDDVGQIWNQSEYKLKFIMLKQRKFTVNHAISKYIIVFKRFNFIEILYIEMV